MTKELSALNVRMNETLNGTAALPELRAGVTAAPGLIGPPSRCLATR